MNSGPLLSADFVFVPLLTMLILFQTNISLNPYTTISYNSFFSSKWRRRRSFFLQSQFYNTMILMMMINVNHLLPCSISQELLILVLLHLANSNLPINPRSFIWSYARSLISDSLKHLD
jgi:hypothetical protein